MAGGETQVPLHADDPSEAGQDHRCGQRGDDLGTDTAALEDGGQGLFLLAAELLGEDGELGPDGLAVVGQGGQLGEQGGARSDRC